MIDIEKLKRKNFNPGDFFYSKIAIDNSIDNITNYPTIIDCLVFTADKIQEIRDLLAQSVKINSGYRCHTLNEMVGGKRFSQHLYGQAVDFISPKFGTPKEIFKFLKDKKIEVDQCLLEKTWIHVSIKGKGNRNQWGSYINGIFKPL